MGLKPLFLLAGHTVERATYHYFAEQVYREQKFKDRKPRNYLEIGYPQKVTERRALQLKHKYLGTSKKPRWTIRAMSGPQRGGPTAILAAAAATLPQAAAAP